MSIVIKASLIEDAPIAVNQTASGGSLHTGSEELVVEVLSPLRDFNDFILFSTVEVEKEWRLPQPVVEATEEQTRVAKHSGVLIPKVALAAREGKPVKKVLVKPGIQTRANEQGRGLGDPRLQFVAIVG